MHWSSSRRPSPGFIITYQLPGLAQSTSDDEMLNDAKIWLSFKDGERVAVPSASVSKQAVPSELVIAPPSPALSEVTCIGDDLNINSSKAKVTELAEEACSATIAPTRRQGLHQHLFGITPTTTNHPLVAELVHGHDLVQKDDAPRWLWAVMMRK